MRLPWNANKLEHRKLTITCRRSIAFAGVATIYTAYDMMQHNRSRKGEFIEAQKRMSAESLEAARLAYMRGDATEEQMKMVDELNAQPEGFKMPSILSAPKPIERTNDENTATAAGDTPAAADTQPEATKSGLWGWFARGSKKEVDQTTAVEKKPRTLEDKRAMLDKAKAAFEQERENQKNGGPLDRIGIETESVASTPPKDAEKSKKTSWLW